MGNDGGSIPKRRELVKEAARNPTAAELKETLQEQQAYLWTTDPLSRRPLSQPVVSDYLGRLFNKDAVIEFLLPADDDDVRTKTDQETLLKGAIKSLKDVVEVKFETSKPANGNGSHANGHIQGSWICPITNKELGIATKAVYLVPCGHAFSESAVREVSGDGVCLQCDQPYAPNDVIPILPTAETDIARLTLRIETLKEKGLAHSLKKLSGLSKKRKKQEVEKQTATDTAPNGTAVAKEPVTADTPKPSSGVSTPQARSGTSTPTTSGIKNASTASLTAKVLLEQQERNKRRKTTENDNLKSLFSSGNSAVSGSGKNRDFMSRGYSIPTHQQR